MTDAPAAPGPNTLHLTEVRLADDTEGEFRRAVFYVDHIVSAVDSGEDTTIVFVSTGDVFEVNMTLDKFITRQRIDKASS